MRFLLLFITASLGFSTVLNAQTFHYKVVNVVNDTAYTAEQVMAGIDSVYNVKSLYNSATATIDAVNNDYIFVGKSGQDVFRLYTVDADNGNIVHSPVMPFTNGRPALSAFHFSDSAGLLVGIYANAGMHQIATCNNSTGVITPLVQINGLTQYLSAFSHSKQQYFLYSTANKKMYIYSLQTGTLDSVQQIWAQNYKSVHHMAYDEAGQRLLVLVVRDALIIEYASLQNVNPIAATSSTLYEFSLGTSNILSANPFSHFHFNASTGQFVCNYNSTSPGNRHFTRVINITSGVQLEACMSLCGNNFSQALPQGEMFTHFVYNRLNQKVYGVHRDVVAPPPAQPLCLVTADSTSTHNIVVWEKVDKAATDSFFIYRETSTNVYTKIAAIHGDSLSEYHDMDADPGAAAFRYKISVRDTNNLFGKLSEFHNTIHLQYLSAGNLSWNKYEIGTGSPVTSYDLYYDTLANGNWTLLLSLPGTQTTATDVNFNMHPNALYRLKANVPFSCTAQRSIGAITSNITSQGAPSAVVDLSVETIRLFPNPFSNYLSLKVPAKYNNGNGYISDLAGRRIISFSISESDVAINTELLSSGLYILKVVNSDGTSGVSKMIRK